MLHPIVKSLPPASRRRFEEAYSNPMRPIAYGEQDDIVVGILQAWLAALGFPLTRSVVFELDDDTIRADGIFWGETRQAVIVFQGSNELVADGLVGHNTLDRIYAKLHQRPPSPPITRSSSVTVVKRPYHCPPGALICPEPP
jgi:hypothetical protein